MSQASPMRPLNGVKTHPLSAHALEVLGRVARGPVPRGELNPGVADRLEREYLIEVVMLPSPYKQHKGKPLRHVQIAAAGKKVLETSK